jgi:vacuolar-type H+-ATPase subunit E/Vma4
MENYDQFLNQSLSSTLSEGKEVFLILKSRLMKELKTNLFNSIGMNIKNKYSNYVKFILNIIKKVKKIVDKHQEIEIIFNTKDYGYFLQNSEKIQDLLKNPVEINKDNIDFIGGFKISLSGGLISYDYTIDNLINKKSSFIQSEISKIINDSEIKEIEKEFNIFIQNQKSKIIEYLKQYDQIQI